MNLTLGFSTCPNDTFIFDAIIHKKVDTEGLQFDVVMANPNLSYQFTKKYAHELNNDVIQKHINLYVNNFTVDLGEIGKDAINSLYDRAVKYKVVKKIPQNIFIDYKKSNFFLFKTIKNLLWS